PPLPPGADRQRLVRVLRNELRSGSGDPTTDVVLNLFDDLGPLQVRPKTIQQTPSGRVWSGDLVGRDGYVILTDGPGGVYGIVRITGYGDVVLRAVRNDLSVAVHSPARRPIVCALRTPGPASRRAARRAAAREISDEVVTIDVLTLVSPLAVCGDGG